MRHLILGVAAAAFLLPAAAQAQSCTGNCGTAAPNGNVSAPPAFGPTYSYISTDGGVAGAGRITGVGGTTGSEYSTSFQGAAGDVLNLYFNFVTSDGGTFSDYGFAQLLLDGSSLGYLFTARTTPSGNTSPGFGLPANISTLNPGATPIIAGANNWAQLGTDSGTCYGGTNNGCGSTGWIASTYTLGAAGAYTIRFGVSNISDSAYDTGLAFAGVTVNNVPVGGVPEPTTWAMLIGGVGLTGGALRRRKATTTVAFA